MKTSGLRWLFLAVAVLLSAWMLFREATPLRLAIAVACAALWLLMSRRKVLSLDRESLGLAPRRNPWGIDK